MVGNEFETPVWRLVRRLPMFAVSGQTTKAAFIHSLRVCYVSGFEFDSWRFF